MLPLSVQEMPRPVRRLKMSYLKKTLLVLILLACLFPKKGIAAEQPAPTEIYTIEDLLRIADDPSGNYILMSDLDLKDVAWPAITFSGTFDGNGHILLNLNILSLSSETRVTYDGNRKTYDTSFGGLFAILEKGTVKNLRLLGTDINITTEHDCFLGGIAGFASESTIENCELSGTVRLDVNAKMFGVGGIIGYGNCVIKNCRTDMTLINIDLDSAHRDEQFLGGVCAAGYPDMEGCVIGLSGFISDHGYVHSGGLVGMYIVYPKRFSRNGFIRDNQVDGFITFFEDNTDRRAYCEKRCGEIMDWQFTESGNVYHFKRDERKTYKVNLLPHGDCAEASFTDTVVNPTCSEPGYTYHLCDTCGYTYKDAYTLPVHNLSEDYETVKESTLTETGIGLYTCTECGAKLRGTLPMLTPSPTPTPTSTPTPTPTPSENPSDGAGNASSNTLTKNRDASNSSDRFLIPVLIGLLVAAGGFAAYNIIQKQRNR